MFHPEFCNINMKDQVKMFVVDEFSRRFIWYQIPPASATLNMTTTSCFHQVLIFKLEVGKRCINAWGEGGGERKVLVTLPLCLSSWLTTYFKRWKWIFNYHLWLTWLLLPLKISIIGNHTIQTCLAEKSSVRFASFFPHFTSLRLSLRSALLPLPSLLTYPIHTPPVEQPR